MPNDTAVVAQNSPVATGKLAFRKFGRSEFEAYKKYYAQIDPVSDLSPNNSVVWLDIADDLFIAEDGNNVVLRYSDPFKGEGEVFSIVGIDHPLRTIQNVFAYQQDHGLAEKLIMTPQTTLNHLTITELKSLVIQEDKENFDYIYSVTDKANLTSEKAAKFRRTINRFIRDYGEDVLLKEVDLKDLGQMNKIINTLHVWKSESIVSNNDKLNIESIAIDRYMRHRSYLEPRCLAIYIDGVIAGFSIYHYPPQANYAIINHIKCNYAYRHIFDFVFFCVMNRLKMDGIAYANGEQDLGMTGIRDYKHKLGPVKYIKRYTITPKKLPRSGLNHSTGYHDRPSLYP